MNTFMNFYNIAMSLDWTKIAGVAAAFVLFFDRLAKITPTESDNVFVSWLYSIFAVLGVKVEDNTGK